MSQCVACGSVGNGGAKLEVQRVVEYLEYEFPGGDVANGSVTATVDVFTVNRTPLPLKLSILHRGNIAFSDVTAPQDAEAFADMGWFGDGKYTRVFRALFGRYFSVESSQAEGWVRLDPKRRTEDGASRYVVRPQQLHRIDPGGEAEGHVPFSLFQTEAIRPGQLRLFRFQGHLAGPSYQVLTQGRTITQRRSPVRSFPIYGGDVVIRLTQRELQHGSFCSGCPVEQYGSLLKEFDSKQKVLPSAYHLIVPTQVGPQRLRVRPVSGDLICGADDERIGEGIGPVCWYWSESPKFYADGVLNGLQLHVEVLAP